MADRIQIRRDTAANWALANPVLAIGELGFETDTLKLKIGSGSETWNSLAYVLDATAYATPADVTAAVAALVDSAPGTLDTLNELAQSLGDDANFASTVTAALSAKANTADLATVATTGAYADVTGTPTLATVATTGAYADVTGTPTLATVATTGAYADVTGTPTLATVATTGSYNDLTDQPAGGGSFEAVASGSLSDGSTVVLNADGTVSVVAEESIPAGPGSASVYESADVRHISATFDSNSNKVVIAYQDYANSQYGTAVVGTVSGNSISFGTPVVFESAGAQYISATFDSNSNKVVIGWQKITGSKGWAIVGTVSGTSISFGTSVLFHDSGTYYTSATFDSNSNKVVFAFYGGGVGTSVVGTVSGTSISFGTPVIFETGQVEYVSTTFDSANNKVVIACQDKGNSNYGTVVVGTVSDSSISFGTPVVFENALTTYISTTFDSANNKVVIGYRDGGNSNYGTAIVGTVSGTSISFGSPVIFENVTLYEITTAFDSTNNKVLILFRSSSTGASARLGTVSGTSISFETKVVVDATGGEYPSATFDLNSNNFVLSYRDGGNSNYGTAVVYATTSSLITNLTAENYAGIADAAYADAATATIQTAGSVDDAQSGLTPGQAYYVQANGTLGLTPGTPSVFAGTAVSATSLLIGKEAPAATVAYADVTGTPDLSSYATETYVTTAVSNLVDTAPDALNTLNELAAALNDDADFAGTVTTSLAAKANTADLATVATTGAYSDLTGTPTIPADVSDLTDTTSLLGGGGGSFEAVASGSLSNGTIVALKADGTVGFVGNPGQSAGFSAFSTDVDGGYERYTYAGPGKIVIAYESGGNALAVVGTITTSEITFGTPVQYKAGAIDNAGNIVLAYNPVLDSVALFYTSGGSYPNQTIYSVVGNISGDTISFNASTAFATGSWDNTDVTYDVEDDRIIIWYREASTGYGRAAVVSMTSTTATRAGVASFNTANSDANYATHEIQAAYNPVSGNHMVTYLYRLGDGTYQNKIKLGYVSGNSISFGSEYATTGYRINKWSACHVTGTFMVYAWSNTTNAGGPGNNYIQMRVGSEAAGAGNISYGTTYTVASEWGTDVMVAYDSINNKGVILYNSLDGTWQGKYRTFTVSNLQISFDSVQLRPGGGDTWPFDYRSNRLYFDASIGKVVGRYDNKVFTLQTADTAGGVELTAENYAGISDGVYADGATATIQTAGSVDDAQSGLTPGQAYYVQANGTLGLTPGTPSVFAGTAVSATSLLIGKEAPAATVAYADVTGTPDLSSYATETYVTTAVSNLVDTAPDALNTLNELAAALNDDADFAGTVTTSLAAKANTADLATVATSGSYNDLTDQPVIAAGGGSFQAVASGSISDGAPAILNSNGTVAAITEEVTTALLQTLNNPNAYGTSAGDSFGYVAISGNYAIVGANAEDDAGGTSSGKAYIFNVTTGALLHTLNNPNPYGTSENDYFGQKVSLSGDYAIIGVSGEDDAGGTSSGKAYIYNVTTGALVHTLDNPNPYGTSASDQFGSAVAISGNYAIVGAYAEDDAGGEQSGKAYIYNVTTGALVHTLNNPTAYSISAYDFFGHSVAISGNYAIVGAIYEDDASGSTSGKAYIFNVTTGALVHTLDNPTAYGTGAGDNFGWSVAISGDYAIIGVAYENDAGGTSSGKAYIFNVTTGALVHTLDNPTAYGTSEGDLFGYSVAMSGNYALISAVGEDDAGGISSGKAYIFNVTTGALVYTYDNPNAYDTSTSDQFSYAIAISDDYAIVGAITEDDAGGSSSGKAYIYSVPATTTNLTAENYAGIADASYSDGATATIQTAGSVDDAQSGLTPGQAYYVQANGTLGLTPGTPSVFAGTAVSATKLLIGKEGPAVDLSSYASTSYVNTAVSNLVDTAPEALNTLNELAAALNDDADFAGTVTTSLSTKLGTDSVIDGGTV